MISNTYLPSSFQYTHEIEFTKKIIYQEKGYRVMADLPLRPHLRPLVTISRGCCGRGGNESNADQIVPFPHPFSYFVTDTDIAKI
jgi:hypothetical protein